MKNRFLKAIFIFFSVLLCFFDSNAAMTDEKVRAFLNDTGEKLIETIGSDDKWLKYQTLDQMFDTKFDVSYGAKFVLGVYYKKMDESQKAHFQNLFARYLKALYKSYPLEFETKGINFEVLSIDLGQPFTNAYARIKLPEQFRTENLESVRVDFKITQRQNDLLLVDFKIAETSMLLTLRNRVLQMIKDDEEELSWFLEDFEDLVLSHEKNVEF